MLHLHLIEDLKAFNNLSSTAQLRSARPIQRAPLDGVEALANRDQHLRAAVLAFAADLHIITEWIGLEESPVLFEAPEVAGAPYQGDGVPPLAFLSNALPLPGIRVEAVERSVLDSPQFAVHGCEQMGVTERAFPSHRLVASLLIGSVQRSVVLDAPDESAHAGHGNCVRPLTGLTDLLPVCLHGLREQGRRRGQSCDRTNNHSVAPPGTAKIANKERGKSHGKRQTLLSSTWYWKPGLVAPHSL